MKAMSRGEMRASTSSWSSSGTKVSSEPLGGTTPPMVVTCKLLTMPRTGEFKVSRSSESARPRTTDDKDFTTASALASSSRLRTM
ncbi:hypothetical protein D9M69_606580 [compost metagenome]